MQLSQKVDPDFGFNHIQNYIKQINATLMNNKLHEKLNTTKIFIKSLDRTLTSTAKLA